MVNMPECPGSRKTIDKDEIDDVSKATCPVCGQYRSVNSDGTMRKHDGRPKGPIAAEKLIPVEQAEPAVPKVVKKVEVEKVQVTHPPTKEIGLIVNIHPEDEADLAGTTEWLKEHLNSHPLVKYVTLTHAKYYYEGKFYNAAEWNELTNVSSGD